MSKQEKTEAFMKKFYGGSDASQDLSAIEDRRNYSWRSCRGISE